MKVSVKSVSTALFVFLLLCMGAWVLESQTKFLQKTYDEIVLDNRNHYLSCDQLPSVGEVRQIMNQHQDVIKKIEQIHAGFVGVELDDSACPGKADIVFWYGTHQDRLSIEEVIVEQTFYGIPYRLQNR